MLLTLLDAPQIFELGVVERTVNLSLEELRVAEDCLQRRAELVTEQRQKIRLDAIGDLRFFARLALARQQLVLDSIGGGQLRSA